MSKEEIDGMDDFKNYEYIDYVEEMRLVQQEGLELFKKKNQDYGNAFEKFGLIGVLVRLEDKIQRCLSIDQKKIVLVNDESMKDTLLDLHNYSAMALMLMNHTISKSAGEKVD